MAVVRDALTRRIELRCGTMRGHSAAAPHRPIAMTDDTLFAKIIRREIPADIVHEDEHVLGFRDIDPKAPVHVLFVPKLAIATLDDASPEHAELLGRLMLAAADYARQQGFAEQGYRVVMNCRDDGGQSVYHIHLHLLAGRRLTWPPG